MLVRVQWSHTTHKTRHFHEEKKIIGNFLTNTYKICVNTQESEERKPTILSRNSYCNHLLVPFVDFHWTESVEVHSSKREYRFLKKGRHYTKKSKKKNIFFYLISNSIWCGAKLGLSHIQVIINRNNKL